MKASTWAISSRAMRTTENNVITVPKMDDLMPVLLETLNAGKQVQLSPRGTSMLPMIRQGDDRVVLAPVSDAPEKYDVALYRSDNGQYMLHRIVEVSDTFTFMGDSRFASETGIRKEQIIGVMTGFYRGENYYSAKHRGYRLYCVLWHGTRPVRHFIHRAIGWLRRHLK